MEDHNKIAEGSSMANELDMLYAASFFQRGFDVSNSQHGPYPGLFISDDVVFPPSEHENLPIEPEVDESNNNKDAQGASCDENLDKGCNEPAKEIDDTIDENPSVGSDVQYAKEATSPESKTPEVHADQEKDNTERKCDIPCEGEGWWKRKSNCVSHHIKGVTTVCTIVAAGALMGFVIMGQRWQQDRLHLHHFQFSVNSEGVSRVIGLFSRCKDALPGSQQLRSLLPTRVLSQQQVSA